MKQLLDWMQFLFLSDRPEMLVKLLQYVGSWLPQQGIYEVLEHHVTLELVDPAGKLAIYRKDQRVRFVQDHVIAFYDTAFGNGDLFKHYQCSPGKAVDRFHKGNRIYTLISLRTTRMRGEESVFRIERHIGDGFCQSEEYLQVDIDHRTSLASVTIIFPKNRVPHSITQSQKTRQQTSLLTDQLEQLPDGRYQLCWEKRHPRQYDSYILAWVW